MHSLVPVFAALTLVVSIGAAPALGAATVTPAAPESVLDSRHEGTSHFAETVRAATESFRNLALAEAAGYGLLHGCVSGSGGAMGVHYVNGDLVGDPTLDATLPEVLMYEWRNGTPRLVGVEYVVLADAWNAGNAAPPVLGGQLFHYTGAPNRYGIPAFYSLHVWAWRHNPAGLFADWNPRISCAGYTGT